MSALKNTWYFPDMFYPASTELNGYVSHEAICVLNPSNQDASLKLTLFYENSEPIEDLCFVCKARTTNHIRLDQVKDRNGDPIQKEVGYAGMLESDVPVVAQYTRVDTSQGNLALMTTLGVGE